MVHERMISIKASSQTDHVGDSASTSHPRLRLYASTMPSANTETDTSQKKLANTGYKEIFTGPGGFDREIEEIGNHIYPPASVSSH
jgi:hypothetical protein